MKMNYCVFVICLFALVLFGNWCTVCCNCYAAPAYCSVAILQCFPLSSADVAFVIRVQYKHVVLLCASLYNKNASKSGEVKWNVRILR